MLVYALCVYSEDTCSIKGVECVIQGSWSDVKRKLREYGVSSQFDYTDPHDETVALYYWPRTKLYLGAKLVSMV